MSNVCLFVLLVASKSGEYLGAHQYAHTPFVKVKQATPRQARTQLLSATSCEAALVKVGCKCSLAVKSGTKHGCTAVLTRTGSNSNPPFCKGFGREGKRREPQRLWRFKSAEEYLSQNGVVYNIHTLGFKYMAL